MPIMSSLELFEKLRKRYREIDWYSDGFSDGISPTVDDFRIFQNEKLLLVPGFRGYKDSIPRTAYASRGQMPFEVWLPRYGREGSDWRPSFNIRTGAIVFDFSFNPATGKDLMDQFEETVLRTLRAVWEKERCFFMDPKFELRHPSNKPDLVKSTIHVEFSHTGDPIPGLFLGEVMVNDWTFFIPEGPERGIIQIALDLEEAENESKKYHLQDPRRESIESLRKHLEESLSAIAM